MTINTARAWKLAGMWARSLLVVGLIASALTSAQVRPDLATQTPRLSPLVTEGPRVLSGNDIGFRVERTRDGVQIGTLVVRVDGRWVEAESPVRMTPTR